MLPDSPLPADDDSLQRAPFEPARYDAAEPDAPTPSGDAPPIRDMPPGSAEVFEAEVVEQPVRLPHPNLLLALLLAALPTVVQIGVGVALVIVSFVVLNAVQGEQLSIEQVAERLNPLLLPIGTLTTMLLALGVAAIGFGRQTARRLGWRNCTLPQWIATVLLVLPLAIVASEASNWASELVSALDIDLLESLRESNSEMFADFVNQFWVLIFVGGCLLPGIGEEIYCRGILGRGLVGRHGVVVGVVATSLLFGAMHLEPVQATSAFVLGLGLHGLFLVTRSLPTAVVLHTLNNFSAFLVMRYAAHLHIPGLTAAPDDAIEHTPSWLLAAAFAAVLVLGLLLYQTRTCWLLPDGSVWSPGYSTGESPPTGVPARAVNSPPSVLLAALTLVIYGLLVVALVTAHQMVPAEL